MLAPSAPLSTADLKLARLRNGMLERYAESHGVDLTPEPVCGVCGGHPAAEPAECGNARCPSFPEQA